MSIQFFYQWKQYNLIILNFKFKLSINFLRWSLNKVANHIYHRCKMHYHMITFFFFLIILCFMENLISRYFIKEIGMFYLVKIILSKEMILRFIYFPVV